MIYMRYDAEISNIIHCRKNSIFVDELRIKNNPAPSKDAARLLNWLS